MGLEFRDIYTAGKVSSWVKTLAGRSGVYVIKEKGFLGSVVYVGESHTGRLKKTLLRHFQKWKGATAGPTFTASKVEIAIVRTPDKKAVETQNALIEEYRPELNTIGKPPGFWETILG